MTLEVAGTSGFSGNAVVNGVRSTRLANASVYHEIMLYVSLLRNDTGSMQRSSFVRPTLSFLVLLYASIGCGIFLSAADNYLGRAAILPLPPTLAALFFLIPLAIILILFESTRANPLSALFTLYRQNAPIVVPFIAIAFFSLTFALHPTAYWDEEAKWIFLNCYNLLIFLFACLLPLYAPLHRRFYLLSLAGLVALVWSIWSDVMVPMSFSMEFNRPAGFPGNSNWAALALVMLCAATLRYNADRYTPFDLLVLALTGFGVFHTLSRSGMLNFLVLGMYYMFTTYLGNRRRSGKVAVLLLLLTGIGTLLLLLMPMMLENTQLVTSNKATNRLTAFLSGKVVDDGSSAGRLSAVQDAVRLIEEAPLLGHGTGFSRTMTEKPHNLYLSQWVNNGIPGLLAYLALLGGALRLFARRRTPQGVALIIVALVGSFFSHNVLEQRTFLILLGCLVTISLLDEQERQVTRRTHPAVTDSPYVGQRA